MRSRLKSCWKVVWFSPLPCTQWNTLLFVLQQNLPIQKSEPVPENISWAISFVVIIVVVISERNKPEFLKYSIIHIFSHIRLSYLLISRIWRSLTMYVPTFIQYLRTEIDPNLYVIVALFYPLHLKTSWFLFYKRSGNFHFCLIISWTMLLNYIVLYMGDK